MPRPPATTRTTASIQGSVYSNLADRLARVAGEIFPLHVGDTWLEPPAGARMEDLTVAAHPGMHRYAEPQGLPALLERLESELERRTGAPTERANLLVATGATGGLGAVLGAIAEPGDEVLLLAPYWPLISGIVRSFGGVPVPVAFHGEADSPEAAVEIVRAAQTERTVAVYWNTPSNPTGLLMERPVVEALVAWAQRENLWILSDEVYEDYVFAGEHVYTRPLAPERTFSAHSFSKAYGMAGNRCGYIVGPREAMAALRKIGTHSYYSTPTAAQLAALAVFSDGRGAAWIARARELYQAAGNAAADRLGVARPRGCTFLFLDVGDRLDDRGLGGFLEDCADRGLLVAPGPSFGPYPTSIRLCFTASPPDGVARGVEVLAGVLGR